MYWLWGMERRRLERSLWISRPRSCVVGPRVEWSGDRLAIAETMLLKEIGDVLALADGKATIGAVSVDFQAKELCGGSQISQLEVLREFLDN